MRYEISDYEWTAIKPMLPNKPHGIRHVVTVACSMAPLGFCVQGRLAVPSYNCFVRLASGTRSWMRWLLALAHAESATSINRFMFHSKTIGVGTTCW
jgi:transposase